MNKNNGYWCRGEVDNEDNYSFTVFSPDHGECGVANFRTGYGNSKKEAMDNCEWADKVSHLKLL